MTDTILARLEQRLQGLEALLDGKVDRNVLRELFVVAGEEAIGGVLVHLDGNQLGIRSYDAGMLFRDNDEVGAVQTFTDYNHAAEMAVRWNALPQVKHRMEVRVQTALEVVEDDCETLKNVILELISTGEA